VIVQFAVLGGLGYLALRALRSEEPEFRPAPAEPPFPRSRPTPDNTLVFGDSQAPRVQAAGKSFLGSARYLGGSGIDWLLGEVASYTFTTDGVQHVVVVTGVNDLYPAGAAARAKVAKLVTELRRIFRGCQVYYVIGSWGWGGASSKTEEDAYAYAMLFAEQGAVVVEPPIGPGDPHADKASYREIAGALEKAMGA
jgi:hypothetical protein